MDTSLGDEEDQRERPSHSGGLVLLRLESISGYRVVLAKSDAQDAYQLRFF
jgi:hypothetical protein